MTDDELAARRKARDPGPQTCPECGGPWWDAAVTFEGGRITGYALRIACRECGHVDEVAR